MHRREHTSHNEVESKRYNSLRHFINSKSIDISYTIIMFPTLIISALTFASAILFLNNDTGLMTITLSYRKAVVFTSSACNVSAVTNNGSMTDMTNCIDPSLQPYLSSGMRFLALGLGLQIGLMLTFGGRQVNLLVIRFIQSFVIFILSSIASTRLGYLSNKITGVAPFLCKEWLLIDRNISKETTCNLNTHSVTSAPVISSLCAFIQLILCGILFWKDYNSKVYERIVMFGDRNIKNVKNHNLSIFSYINHKLKPENSYTGAASIAEAHAKVFPRDNVIESPDSTEYTSSEEMFRESSQDTEYSKLFRKPNKKRCAKIIQKVQSTEKVF